MRAWATRVPADLRLTPSTRSSQICLNQREAILRSRNNNGETLLQFAFAAGQVEMVNYLLSDDVGLYVDENASRGWTPYLSALAPGFPNIVGLSEKSETAQLLLSHGANPIIAIQDGWTPLHCLTMHYGSHGTDEKARLIEKLVSRGNLVNARLYPASQIWWT